MPTPSSRAGTLLWDVLRDSLGRQGGYSGGRVLYFWRIP